jgi:hypothetical protein
MATQKKQKDISDILQQFNRQISRLFKFADIVAKGDPTIDWARRVIKILRNENPPAVLERCIDKFWDNREPIMTRNVDFFKTCSMDKYIKKDKNKVWLDELIKFIRTRYFDLSESEQNSIWVCMEEMLKNIIKYRIVVGYHA